MSNLVQDAVNVRFRSTFVDAKAPTITIKRISQSKNDGITQLVSDLKDLIIVSKESSVISAAASLAQAKVSANSLVIMQENAWNNVDFTEEDLECIESCYQIADDFIQILSSKLSSQSSALVSTVATSLFGTPESLATEGVDSDRSATSALEDMVQNAIDEHYLKNQAILDQASASTAKNAWKLASTRARIGLVQALKPSFQRMVEIVHRASVEIFEAKMKKIPPNSKLSSALSSQAEILTRECQDKLKILQKGKK